MIQTLTVLYVLRYYFFVIFDSFKMLYFLKNSSRFVLLLNLYLYALEVELSFRIDHEQHI